MATALRQLGSIEFQLADLKMGDQLGDGAFGMVWALQDWPDYVLKQYKNPAGINQAALARVVHLSDHEFTPAEQQFVYDHCAWPLARVVDRGFAVGFIMRKAPSEFLANEGVSSAPKRREAQYLMFEPRPLWGEIEPPDVAGRVEFLRNFVQIVNLLHRHNIVIGDISMMNALFSRTTPTRAFLLDCDSVTLPGPLSVLPPADTPDWDDPRLPAGPGQAVSDRYKLALMVGRVLSRHAYVRPGEPLNLVDGLDANIADGVHKNFALATGEPDKRPDVNSWSRALLGRGSIPLTPIPPPTMVPHLPVPGRTQQRASVKLRPLPPRPTPP